MFILMNITSRPVIGFFGNVEIVKMIEAQIIYIMNIDTLNGSMKQSMQEIDYTFTHHMVMVQMIIYISIILILLLMILLIYIKEE